MSPSPSADLTALIAAVTKGFADVTAAVTASQSAVDLAPLTAEIKKVADALYVGPEGTQRSIGQIAVDANDQVASVIGLDPQGQHRVQTSPDS